MNQIRHIYRVTLMSWKLTWNVLKMSWKEYLNKYIKKIFLGGNNLTWKFHHNFQVKLFPPKNIFFNFLFKYSLNMNSVHWIIKKDIGLYVLFRTFQVNFQDIYDYVDRNHNLIKNVVHLQFHLSSISRILSLQEQFLV